MRRWGQQKPAHLDEKELRADLGRGNTIFVGSGIDMWADEIPDIWIFCVLDTIWAYDENTYLFQSKNPKRFKFNFPLRNKTPYIVCTTIETNRTYQQMGKTPSPHDRAFALSEIPGRKMVTIEPIMDFDLLELVYLLKVANPEQVNIGSDSKRHGLPEPPAGKIRELIAEVETFTKVYQKPNLARLMGEGK